MESSYPVYYEYGEYSVTLSHLSSEDVETLRDLLKPLGVILQKRGVTF